MKRINTIVFLCSFMLMFCFSLSLAELKNPPPGFDSPFGLGGASYFHMRHSADKWEFGSKHHQLFNLTGAKWARQDFWWSSIETSQGRFDWEFPDQVVAQYRKYGINLFPIICYGSAWQHSEAPITESERKLAARYTYLLVSRYRNTVHAWEIWNEPNILPFWSPKPNPADYAALLKECYIAAKNADPNCIVVAGALAGVDESFLRGMYQHGAKGYFDALSYHTYGQNPPERYIQNEINLIRKIMAEFGDDKPIWMTETGYYTGPAGISEEQQAKWIVRSHLCWLSAGVDKIFELTMLDWTDDPNTPDGTSFRGIAHRSFDPKPAFYAYRTMTEMLDGKQFYGNLKLSPEVYGALFTAKGYPYTKLPHATLVLWTDDNKEKTVTFDPGANTVLVHNLHGDRKLLKVDENNQIQIKVTDAPIYLEGIGEKILLQSQFVQLNESYRQLAYLSENTIKLRFYNPLSTALRGEVLVYINKPKLDLTHKSLSLELAPNEKKEISIALSKSDCSILGETELVIKYSSPDIGNITVFEQVEIVNPIKLKFLPVQRSIPPKFDIQLENYSGKEVEGTLQVTLVQPFDHQWSLPVKLATQTTAIYSFSYDPDMIESFTPYQLSVTFIGSGYSATADKTYTFILVPKATKTITIDGELSDWTEPTITPQNLKVEFFNQNAYTGSGDITATAYLAWAPGKLYLAIDVTDDKIILATPPTVWDQDSLQIAIDGLNDAEPKTGFDNNDFEFEIALTKDGKNYLAAGHYPAGRIESVVPEKVQVAIKQKADGKGLIYELMIPEEVVLPLTFESGRIFGFNFILNDNDTGLRKGWLELAPGIGWGKEPAKYYDVILME
ncbi:MAG: hypothetical protein N3A72_02655 [bacterium]|nr:hypothetical protein [bacterium]